MTLAAVVGFLLVGVRGAAYDAVLLFPPGDQEGAARLAAQLVGLLGALATLVFGLPVLASGWRALRGREGGAGS